MDSFLLKSPDGKGQNPVPGGCLLSSDLAVGRALLHWIAYSLLSQGHPSFQSPVPSLCPSGIHNKQEIAHSILFKSFSVGFPLHIPNVYEFP